MPPIEFTDLSIPQVDNPAGTRLLVSYAPIDTFATIAKPAGDTGTGNDDLAAIKTDHTFKTGGRFYKVELEVNKNELNGEYQGAVVGGAHKQSFTGFLTNLTAAQQGLLRKMIREKHIVLVHLADNQVVQLGEENNGAMIVYNAQTGLQEGGERGNTLTVTAYHNIQFYQGAISYTAAP